jgi:hypothetical protein
LYKTSNDAYNPTRFAGPALGQSIPNRNLEETLKSTCTLLLALLLFVSISAAQSAPAARTDVYHVHFAKAALGKAIEEGNYLKTADPNVPMSAHRIVLRHQEGEDWDYVTIQHLGTKATVEATGIAVPAAMRDLSAWHNDTFVNGPSWSEFSKALGIDEGSVAKTAGSVYVVSVYRAAPGHRDQLEKSLSQNPTGDTSSGTVLMQHLEGGPWTYLTVVRYNSWQDFATTEKNGAGDTLKPDGGWLQLREHSTYHNDTLTDRIAP